MTKRPYSLGEKPRTRLTGGWRSTSATVRFIPAMSVEHLSGTSPSQNRQTAGRSGECAAACGLDSAPPLRMNSHALDHAHG